MDEIHRLSYQTDFNSLNYGLKDKSAPKYFISFKGPLILYDNIKNGYMNFKKAEEIQEEFKFDLIIKKKVNGA